MTNCSQKPIFERKVHIHLDQDHLSITRLSQRAISKVKHPFRVSVCRREPPVRSLLELPKSHLNNLTSQPFFFFCNFRTFVEMLGFLCCNKMRFSPVVALKIKRFVGGAKRKRYVGVVMNPCVYLPRCLHNAHQLAMKYLASRQ